MKHTLFALGFAGLCASTLACGQTPAAPSSSVGGSLATGEAGPDGSTLKVSAPGPVSPAGGQELDDNDPDLVITNASAHFVADVPLEYVFEVFRDGQLVYRSAPVPAGPGGQTSHETAELLDYDAAFTWRAYAVHQGQRGPMSEAAAFRTVNRFGPSCAHLGSELAIVECRRAQYDHIPHDELPEFLAKVAYDLNAAGMEHAPYGRLLKDTGNNCHGYSCDIICAGQGNGQRQWDVLIDEDEAQIPVWNRVGAGVSRACEPVQ